MFWPDAATLSRAAWWGVPAWEDGATYGQLVEAVRPALRAALLLGWDVGAIEVGIGAAAGQSSGWVSIERATLELVALPPQPDTDTPFLGPNLALRASEVLDLYGDLGVGGTYAVPIAFPVLGGDELPEGIVPAGVHNTVDAFVNDAIDQLLPTLPDPQAPPPSDGSDPSPAKAAQQGLLWTLYAQHWLGLNSEARRRAGLLPLGLRMNPLDTLIGELYGTAVSRPPRDFWTQVGLSAQAEGKAHHLPQRARDRLVSMTWLDSLAELLVRGVIEIPALVDPVEPPHPVELVEPEGDQDETVTELTLSIWGGDSQITLRRVATFADEEHDDLSRSVTWDYVPGNARQRPTVVLVAGRGVQIEADPEVTLVGRTSDAPIPAPGTAAGRRRRRGLPWDLLVHRVMDDALIPLPGAKLSPLLLRSPSVIDADPAVGLPPTKEPALLVVPKHDGVLIQFPARGTQTPSTTATGHDIPRVIELTIPDPTSGRSAWAADVHFFSYQWGTLTPGGAHLCVWTTPDIQIHTNDSPSDSPTRGDPSFVTEEDWISSWQYSAELWEADDPTGLARPFSAVLPIREGSALRPDLLERPARLEYSNGRAVHHGITLTPALHAYRQFGYLDSLAFDVMDVIVGFVPFLGDVADIGEALNALRTGRDKWCRPVSRFELGLMLAGAAVPIVSSGILRQIGGLLAGTVDQVPVADLERFGEQAPWSLAWPADQVEATRSVRELTEPEGARVSPGHKAKAEQLIRDLAADDSSIRAVADRLTTGRAAGWPTIAETLSQDQDGFLVPALQTAWLRYQRDNPAGILTPDAYARWLKAPTP